MSAEMDETKVGTEVVKAVGKGDTFRWVFGITCRRTRLSSLYYVKNRNMNTLHKIIKEHCLPGSIIFSDSASTYCVQHGARSHLA